MNKNDILTFLSVHKNEMQKRFGLLRIGLFGSYARDEATQESDIDFVVQMKKKDFFIREDLREYLEEHLKRNVDIGYIDSFREYYKNKIEKEIIYV